MGRYTTKTIRWQLKVSSFDSTLQHYARSFNYKLLQLFWRKMIYDKFDYQM